MSDGNLSNFRLGWGAKNYKKKAEGMDSAALYDPSPQCLKQIEDIIGAPFYSSTLYVRNVF